MTFPVSLPRSRIAPPMEAPALRWGVLGSGWIAAQFIASVRAHTRQSIAAVGSRTQVNADASAHKWEIATAYGISQNHLMKVVHQLARAGVVESVRGKGGGLRLARPPEAIRIGEIVRATEGDAPIVECLSDDPHACRISGVCRLTRVLVDGFDALYESLNRYTLADLSGNRRALTTVLMQTPAHRAAGRARGGVFARR